MCRIKLEQKSFFPRFSDLMLVQYTQKVIYACVILVAANLGGSFTVIGDMTSLMLWVREVITPSAFALGIILPAVTTLCLFNLLLSTLK